MDNDALLLSDNSMSCCAVQDDAVWLLKLQACRFDSCVVLTVTEVSTLRISYDGTRALNAGLIWPEVLISDRLSGTIVEHIITLVEGRGKHAKEKQATYPETT